MAPSRQRWFRLILHYDGSAFQGWQFQPDARTVQEELEKALSRLADQPVRTVAAGRTDSGVHATGQVASAPMPERWTDADLRKALNAILPRDIWTAGCAEVPSDFHARFAAVGRGYVYRLGTADAAASPLRRRWCWVLGAERGGALRSEFLQLAAERLVGEHSFGAFAKSGQPERSDRCHVHEARWLPWEDLGFAFQIKANRFLHRMVRYLVGTMVDVARGKRELSDLDRLLRGEPGFTTSDPAPPEGLFLARVYYSIPELARQERLDEDLP